MPFIILTIFYLALCYKWGDWKNWRKYYSSILYFIIGDLVYNFIFCDHLLWEYGGFSHTFYNMLIMFFVFPSIVILFFTYYPKTIFKKGLYILLWTALNTLIELIIVKTGYFLYNYGWNLLWSAGVFFFAFILISIHYKHPLIVWPISCALVIITMYIFGLQIAGLK